jgi:hypothetical protein
MKDVKSILIGVLLIVVLLFFFKQSDEIIVERVTVDTLYVPIEIPILDTLYVDVLIPQPSDTVFIENGDTLDIKRYMSTYNTPDNRWKINLDIGTTGELKFQRINIVYNRIITHHTTIINRETILTYKENPLYLGIGGMTGYNNFQPSLALGGSIQYKQHLFAYHYDIHKTHWVTYHKQFQLKPISWKKLLNF